MSQTTKTCRGYAKGGIAPHEAPDDNSAVGFPPGKNQCRQCYRAYYEDWKAQGPRIRRPRRGGRDFSKIDLGAAEQPSEEFVSEEEAARSHEYRPDPTLVQLWHAVVSEAAAGGSPASILFLGPSGSGKTAGAQHLASLVGLPFTKVDAASMTDAMDWFGTREVVERDGASVTEYNPSDFVVAIQRPGVVLIDEVNRIRDEHRNIILPLTDGTGRVTNPLTGETVVKDPKCFIIMSGNRGLQFTGTFAIDPALLTRALVVPFDYAKPADERLIVAEAAALGEEHADAAETLVRFAAETRQRAKNDPDMVPTSTRELISAAKLLRRGLSLDLAVRFACITGAESDTARLSLEQIWAGIRRAPGPNAVGGSWSCSGCARVNAASSPHCENCGAAR